MTSIKKHGNNLPRLPPDKGPVCDTPDGSCATFVSRICRFLLRFSRREKLTTFARAGGRRGRRGRGGRRAIFFQLNVGGRSEWLIRGKPLISQANFPSLLAEYASRTERDVTYLFY